jgi:putative exporter of polyketide antibiotics
MQILVQFDVEISNTTIFIGFTVSNNTVSIQSVELVVCSGLESRVLVGFLMGVIYWLVGVCSEARRILSILWVMKIYRVVSCFCVMMGNVRRVRRPGKSCVRCGQLSQNLYDMQTKGNSIYRVKN